MTDRVFEVHTAPVGTPIPRDLDFGPASWSRLGLIGDLDAAEFIKRSRFTRFDELFRSAVVPRLPALRISGFSITEVFVDEVHVIDTVARTSRSLRRRRCKLLHTPRSLRRRRCKLRRKRAMRRRRR